MVDKESLKKSVDDFIAELNPKLRQANRHIHDNPELGYEEHIAHDTLSSLLEECGFKVTRHAYGLDTAFEAVYGEGGRLVNFNCEIDALPMGHACGHNLNATSAVTAFLALSHILKQTGAPGRVQILGTPAEENGGGKIALYNNGAYKGVDASLMAHASGDGTSDAATFKSLARGEVDVTFKGKPAHAGANPWDGVNALDAFVLFYNNLSLLRQQCPPDTRIHGCLLEGPKVPNIIPDHTKCRFQLRSGRLKTMYPLMEKLKNCAKAAALATGCEVEIQDTDPYADMLSMPVMNDRYLKNLKLYGIEGVEAVETSASTDQANISYLMPNIHGIFRIPGAKGNPHQSEFVVDSGTDAGHDAALTAGKTMAFTGFDVLADDEFFNSAHKDWQKARAEADA